MKRLQAAVCFAVMCAFASCVDPTGGLDGGSDSGVALTDGGHALDAGSIVDAGRPPPTITATHPIAAAVGAPMNVVVTATFSESMLSASAIGAFTLSQGNTVIAGVASYSATTVSFVPTTTLAANTEFTATVLNTAVALDGQHLTTTFSWHFTTGAMLAQGPAPVSLGAAGNFIVLAKTAVSSVPPSVLTGDIGLSPAAATFLTGFSLTADATNVFSTSAQVTGKLYAADLAVPTPANLTTAVGNMEDAYTDAAGRSNPDASELGAGAIGGLTLAPGLYTWTSTVSIATNVTLQGGSDDVWILKTTGGLTSSAATRVILSGGAQAKNIYWQVAGDVTLGSTSHFEGIVLAKTAVTLGTGATLNGRVLAQSQVALQQATITAP